MLYCFLCLANQLMIHVVFKSMLLYLPISEVPNILRDTVMGSDSRTSMPWIGGDDVSNEELV